MIYLSTSRCLYAENVTLPADAAINVVRMTTVLTVQDRRFIDGNETRGTDRLSDET